LFSRFALATARSEWVLAEEMPLRALAKKKKINFVQGLLIEFPQQKIKVFTMIHWGRGEGKG
jgi:hypothetical protein